MKKTTVSRVALHRETLRLLESQEILPVVGGLSGPPGTTCTSIACPTHLSVCKLCT